MTNVVCSAWIS